MTADLPAFDLLRPFQLERSAIRGRLVRLGQTVDHVLKTHEYPEPVSQLLGELLVLAGALAGGLKFDGMFSLQIRSKGPVRLMVADCTNDGMMRGWASFDADAVAATGSDEPAHLLGGGLLALTVDQTRSGGQIYQGIVELEGRSLVEAMLGYFERSEQVPTSMRVALDRDPFDGSWRAGAIILQSLPTREVDGHAAAEDWQTATTLLASATDAELVDPNLAPDTLLYRLFHEEGVRVFRPTELAFGCSCDEERVTTVLMSFPLEDLEDMRLPDGSIAVTCQFCSRKYLFDMAVLAELLHPRRH